MYTFLLILVALAWGATFFVIKNTISSIDPVFTVFGRCLLAAVSMFFFLIIKSPKTLISGKAFLKGLILGALIAGIYISQTLGLKFTSCGHSAFITNTAIIFVPVLMLILFRKMLTGIQVVCIISVFMGLFLITYNTNTAINPGDLITFITALFYALYIVISGYYVKNTDYLPMIFYQFTFASIFSLIGYLIAGNPLGQITVKGLIGIGYLGFIGTLFCFFIMVWIQKYMSSIKVILILSLEPISATFFGIIILGETLTQKDLIGALLIIIGIIAYHTYKSGKLKATVANNEEFYLRQISEDQEQLLSSNQRIELKHSEKLIPESVEILRNNI